MATETAEFITEKQTLAKLGISRATLRKLVKAQQFAPRYQLSPGRVAFKVSEVEAWADSCRESV